LSRKIGEGDLGGGGHTGENDDSDLAGGAHVADDDGPRRLSNGSNAT
jgi:hypothetical protein